MTDQQIPSKRENAPVESLPVEIARLTGTIEFWNNVRLAVMMLAVLAAVGAFFAQRMALVRAKQASVKQSELLRLKDEQLREELAEKDLRIGEANALAANANNSVAQANERAARLEKEAAEQKERAAAAERSLLTLRKQLGERSVDTAGVRTVAGAPDEPIWIGYVGSDGGEEERFARQIASVLRTAGFNTNLDTAIRVASGIPPGVTVEGQTPGCVL